MYLYLHLDLDVIDDYFYVAERSADGRASGPVEAFGLITRH